MAFWKKRERSHIYLPHVAIRNTSTRFAMAECATFRFVWGQLTNKFRNLPDCPKKFWTVVQLSPTEAVSSQGSSSHLNSTGFCLSSTRFKFAFYYGIAYLATNYNCETLRKFILHACKLSSSLERETIMLPFRGQNFVMRKEVLNILVTTKMFSDCCGVLP